MNGSKESIADNLRTIHLEAVHLLGIVESLVAAGREAAWGDFDPRAELADAFITSLMRGHFETLVGVREAFAAGHLEVCRAIPAYAGLAEVSGRKSSSMHLAAVEFALGALDTLLCNVAMQTSDAADNWSAETVANANDEDLRRELPNWASGFSEFDAEEICSRLTMELAAALLICDRLPSFSGPVGAESLAGVPVRKYGKAPPCTKCGKNTRAKKTLQHIRYWECRHCGETGKQPR
jgi:hypothetical protein